MGLIDNLSRTLASAVSGFNSQASQGSVSTKDVSASLLALGEQLSASGSKDSDSKDTRAIEIMAGSLSNNPVLIHHDLQSKFHDGDFSALV